MPKRKPKSKSINEVREDQELYLGFRLSRNQKQQLAARAEKNYRTISAELRVILRDALKADEEEAGAEEEVGDEFIRDANYFARTDRPMPADEDDEDAESLDKSDMLIKMANQI